MFLAFIYSLTKSINKKKEGETEDLLILTFVLSVGKKVKFNVQYQLRCNLEM